MISPKLYRSSHLYDFFMKSLGYENSIDRFLSSLSVDFPEGGRILDAGCGTGLMGLHFAERFPGSKLVSTDLESNFLKATLANAQKRGIEPGRVSVGTSDISNPAKMTSLDGTPQELTVESFDLVCIGAVVGYADDTTESLRRLLSLVAPGGTLLNLEMNESPTGRFVSHRYRYFNVSLEEMKQTMHDQGFRVSVQSLMIRHLPARFTRVALIAKRPN